MINIFIVKLEIKKIKIIECPRDAMQGIGGFIPTERKAEYINQLLKVGFDTIDFGSFVSPKWIPQLRDTAEVLSMLDISDSRSKLLAIVANVRGASDACKFEQINYLGFPFSISETFQKLNINATIRESLGRVEDIKIVKDFCEEYHKELVIYISMAFGNPYGDEWCLDIVKHWIEELYELGVRIIALSDTIGMSTPSKIIEMFTTFINEFPDVEFGAHFHTSSDSWEEKLTAAFDAGCRRYDGAIRGYGGCPMAEYELVGNMATENLIHYFSQNDLNLDINLEEYKKAFSMANDIFSEVTQA
jgi:hydroxymethylglutaryl-CoA lyase